MRFDEKTRGLNAISFAVMTFFLPVFHYMLWQNCLSNSQWDFDVSIWLARAIVMIYTFLED